MQIARPEAASITCRVERRWVMNFAAAVEDYSPCYYGIDGPPTVHPLYQSHLEWRIRRLLTAAVHVPREVRLRAVHSSQQLEINRLLRVGETVTMRASIVGAERGRSGVRLTTRFDLFDRGGQRISTAVAVAVYRGVELGCEPLTPPAALFADGDSRVQRKTGRQQTLPLTRGAAHIYGECARIWNPIHSDPAVARRAGLPSTIMHGSGLLAMIVSNVISHECDGDPTRFQLTAGRFRAPIELPHRPVLHVSAPRRGSRGDVVGFRLVREDGIDAIDGGVVIEHE
jgi:acyl dehydratase